MEFWRYYRIIRRRRWLIILGMIVCVGAVEINNLNTQQLYTARHTLMETKMVSQQGLTVYPTPMVQYDLQLQLSNLANIATSQKVLDDAASTLNDLGLPYDADQILRSTTVQPVKDSNILAVEVTLPNGRAAKVAADVVASEFKRVYGDLNNAAVRQSREFIEAQIKTARKAMVDAQEALRRFKEENEIVQLDAQSQSAIGRLSQAKVDNNAATIGYQAASARVGGIQRELEKLPEWQTASETRAREPLWQQLKQELLELETLKAAQVNGEPGVQRRGPNHPDVLMTERRIAEVKAKIAQGDIKEQYTAGVTDVRNPNYTGTLDRWIAARVDQIGAEAQREATAGIIAKTQRELGELPAKEKRLAELSMDLKVAVDTYGLMKTKLDEAKIREKQAQNEVALRTLDSAYVFPVNQRQTLKLILALLLSPLLGIGAAFLLHYTDNTVKTPAEAEKLLGLPVLSAVLGSRGHSLPRQRCPEALDVAYQMVTSNLWIANQNHGVKAVAVVSAEPDMGRSVTASNIAVALAREGARVILVDADLRQPTQHLIFGTDNKIGLTNILSGAATLEDALVPTSVQGVLLLPTGPIPDNPVKLLRSPQMKELCDSIAELADFVIYDTPAGVAFPDPVLISSYVGNALIVHSAGRVPRGSEAEFSSRLSSVGVRLLGTVLNKVRREDSSGYFHYYRSYSGIQIAEPQAEKKAIKG